MSWAGWGSAQTTSSAADPPRGGVRHSRTARREPSGSCSAAWPMRRTGSQERVFTWVAKLTPPPLGAASRRGLIGISHELELGRRALPQPLQRALHPVVDAVLRELPFGRDLPRRLAQDDRAVHDLQVL